jgi:hypothetical protein
MISAELSAFAFQFVDRLELAAQDGRPASFGPQIPPPRLFTWHGLQRFRMNLRLIHKRETTIYGDLAGLPAHQSLHHLISTIMLSAPSMIESIAMSETVLSLSCQIMGASQFFSQQER